MKTQHGKGTGVGNIDAANILVTGLDQIHILGPNETLNPIDGASTQFYQYIIPYLKQK